jgi:glycosyltransferase involved in cell wall biosynthesis
MPVRAIGSHGLLRSVAVSASGMIMATLSVLIPARNEKWLGLTVADVLRNSGEQTEIIVVLDGAWPDEPLPQHPRVQIVYLPESIGQRAATNLAARISEAEFIMKLDAHCSMAPGFDEALIKAARELGPRVCQIPAQTNLHVYSRVCRVCGKENYQGPESNPCSCGGACDIKVVWKPRRGTTTTCWVFDSELHFQYASREMRQRQVWKDDIADTMTSLGACIFIARDYFWELGGFDVATGSWGQYGQELACKVWTSGGRHVCNRRTSFSHFFRVGGIGFSYPIKGSDQEYARQYARNLWRGNLWEGQKYPLRWVVDKFWPVDRWTDEQRHALPDRLNARIDRHAAECSGELRVQGTAPAVRAGASPTRGVVHYTDSRVDGRIVSAVQRHIEQSGLPIVSVALKPQRWPAARTIVLPGERGPLQMFRQILAGLEALDTDIAFLCEHDVLYAPDHFRFSPPDREHYFYNLNVWKVDAGTGRAVHYRTKQTSGLCADRQLLIEHYRQRIARVEAEGFSRRIGFEPGSHIVDPNASMTFRPRNGGAMQPNVDIRHTTNLTSSRWSPEQFRDKRHCQGWTEASEIPGWGVTKGRFWEWLAETQGVLA